MACSCTCKKCGLKFDRYSGKLLNISNYMMSLLRDKVESEKHYVLCSDCIEELIGKPITMNMLKFQKTRVGEEWYSSNLLYFYRKTIENQEKVLQNKRFVILNGDDYNDIVELIKKCEKKGIISGLERWNLIKSTGHFVDIRVFKWLLL